MKETIYPPGSDESEAVERLIETVERLKAFTGSVHPSPVFGPMSREQLVQLQLLHMALHLRFLKPPGGEASEFPGRG